MKANHRQAVCFTLFMFYAVHGQEITDTVYGRVNTVVIIKCPFRKTDVSRLIWIGPPYTGYSGTTYIIDNAGANPNTVLGDRLNVTGDHTVGEYNLKISNLQASDKGRYGCENGNERKYYNLVVVVPVTTVSIQPHAITIVEGNSSHVTCTSSDSVPVATVTWYILKQGSSTSVELTRGINITHQDRKTISTLLYIGTAVDNGGYLHCLATNAEQDHPIQSENTLVTVFYPPKYDPLLTGYKPGIILYDGGQDLLLNCQQEGGNPLSVIEWSHTNIDVTDNSSSYISSSNIKLPVDRNLQTCTCLVTYPGSQFDYRRNISLTISVLFLTINDTSNKKTYESTEDIQLQCIASIQHQSITYSWKHTVGSTLIRTIQRTSSDSLSILNIVFAEYQDMGTYTCYGDNIKKEQIKSQDVQIIVNDQPVFTDNISTIKTNGKTEINVDYFSVPKPMKVEWLKDGNVLYKSEKYLQNNLVTEISLTLHTVKVRLPGYRSTITVMKSGQNDYGNYVLRVQNQKGTVLQKISYFAQEEGNELSSSTVIAVVIVIIFVILLIIGGIVLVACLRHKRQENTTSQASAQCDDGDAYENIVVDSITDKNIKDAQLPRSDVQAKNVSTAYEELHHRDNMENIYNVMDTVQ